MRRFAMVAEAPGIEEECRREAREIRQQGLEAEEMGGKLMAAYKRYAEKLGRDKTLEIMREIATEQQHVE